LKPQCFFLRFALLPTMAVAFASGQGAAAAEVPGERRDFLVQNWQTDQGLPRNITTAIAQDQAGYLWFGTPYGLVRFDGVRFVAREGDVSPEFAKGFVQSLRAGQDGSLWIATRRSGLFTQREGGITNVSPAWPAAAVDSVAIDGQGVVWVTDGKGRLGRWDGGQFVKTAELGRIATGPMLFKLVTDAGGGLWFYKQDTFGQIIDGQPTNYTRLGGSVVTLAPRRDGGLWLATGEELRRLPSGQSGGMETVKRLGWDAYAVNALHEDRAGQVWIGTRRRGLYRLSGSTLEKIVGVHHQISDLLEDAEGNIWVATDGAGLFKIRPGCFKMVDESDGLPQESVVCVSGEWVGPQGVGVGRLDAAGRVTMLPEHQQYSVTSLLDDGAGGVWLGTAGGRLIHRSATGAIGPTLTIDGTQLRVLHRDRDGNLWIGGFPSGLFLLSAQEPTRLRNLEAEGFPKASVTAIAQDETGGLWIGTAPGDLYSRTNETFRRFGVAEGFTGFPIGALLPATNGGLWVGTLGGGLGRFRDGRVQFVGRNDGMTDEVVSQLIEDDGGWLWLGGSRGLARVRPGEVEAVLEGRRSRFGLTHYGSSDGLANVQCTVGSQPSVWRTPDGQLRFATSRGVVSFDPASLPVNLRPPPLVLERVLVDGVPVASRSNLRLPHDFKKLEFDYAALSFRAPEKVQFRRQLGGFDEGWIEAGSGRTATYPRLPPGAYVFKFTACNDDSVWNDQPACLPFTVVPTYWQTAWFRAAMIVLFGGLVGGAVFIAARLRLRRKLARLEQANTLERERTRISRDLHDDLGARLTQMALQTDLTADDPTVPAEVQAQIKEVSAQARSAVQSLDETVWMINPQKDTLAHVVAYIAQFAEQFFRATAIHCRMDIARDLPACTVPGNLRRDILMLVKEALNNAQKHAGASEVRLRVAVRPGVLRISIRDNGRGFAADADKPQRHGLGNMRQRAEAAGIGASIHSRPGKGTLVALRLRLGASRCHLTQLQPTKNHGHPSCNCGRRRRRPRDVEEDRPKGAPPQLRRGLRERRGRAGAHHRQPARRGAGGHQPAGQERHHARGRTEGAPAQAAGDDDHGV
jgi:signal transduction histidine kinase/ligand-binding sensor domain-containing protein